MPLIGEEGELRPRELAIGNGAPVESPYLTFTEKHLR